MERLAAIFLVDLAIIADARPVVSRALDTIAAAAVWRPIVALRAVVITAIIVNTTNKTVHLARTTSLGRRWKGGEHSNDEDCDDAQQRARAVH